MNIRQFKTCSRCLKKKEASLFAKHKRHRDGLSSHCKSCCKLSVAKWYRKKQRDTSGLFSRYVAMKLRCHNKNHENYPYYGGRGIHVCDEWRNSFDVFYKWAIENGYKRSLQLDRIDNEKGYCPENCRFVTAVENANNKRKRTAPHRPASKLTVEEVGQIKKLIQLRIPQTEIARLFDVCQSTISCINIRKTWKK